MGELRARVGRGRATLRSCTFRSTSLCPMTSFQPQAHQSPPAATRVAANSPGGASSAPSRFAPGAPSTASAHPVGGPPANGHPPAARTRGFAPSVEQAQIARPTPLPKRPKGRFFCGVLFLGSLAVIGLMIWSSFFRFQAYGLVSGRVIRVSPTWEGVVKSIHVREGELVTQGQLLMTIDNVELRRRMDLLGDELRIAQAGVEAELARLQWESHTRRDHRQEALADYYKLWGEHLREESTLAELTVRRQQAVQFLEHGSISQDEFNAIDYAQAGQKAKVEKLAIAVAELKRRVEEGTQRDEATPPQLKPALARIETLRRQITDVREQLERGDLVAPVVGRVVGRRFFAGERVQPTDTAIEILEEGSLEPVVYLPQNAADDLQVGEHLDIVADSHPDPIRCEVVRLGEKLEAPPESLRHFYRREQRVLPVYLRLPSSASDELAIRLGSEIKLPHSWWNAATEPVRVGRNNTLWPPHRSKLSVHPKDPS